MIILQKQKHGHPLITLAQGRLETLETFAAVLHGCFNGALLVLVVFRGSHHQFLSFALNVLRISWNILDSPVDKHG